MRDRVDAVSRDALAEFNATDRKALVAMLRKMIAALELVAPERG